MLIFEADVSGFAFDGDPGPVADPLMGAGQRVEQGSLTAVGIADQGDGGHDSTTSNSSASASLGRKARE